MAPLVTTIRAPRSRSCSGTTSMSNSSRPTRGSWICAASVRPPPCVMCAGRNKIARVRRNSYSCDNLAAETELHMRGPRLDRIDRRILQLLQENGRMTNIALARRVGISPPPCLRRMRALEAAGLIRGYHADLAPEPLGFAVTVFAQIGLASQAVQDLK